MASETAGWPLSIWLTPDLKPFRIETYLPKTRPGNRYGLIDILESISESWNNPQRREDYRKQGTDWMRAVDGAQQQAVTSKKDDSSPLRTVATAAVRGADREYGGWGLTGPKFPHPRRILLLFRAADRTDRDIFRDIAIETLDAIASSGLYDHLSGGFYRYATDRRWRKPHFEKLLASNAELIQAFLAGYEITGNAQYETVIRKTIEFLHRELEHDTGGFCSSLDSHSESATGTRAEGAYYRWTVEDITDAIDDNPDAVFTASTAERDISLFCDRYGIAYDGNSDGGSVPIPQQTIESLAHENDLSLAQVQTGLDTAHEKVQAALATRPQPPRDETILASWNGLALSAIARAGISLDASLAEGAIATLESIREKLWDEQTQTLERWTISGESGTAGFLEDYAFLGCAAVDCYQATGNLDALVFAGELADAIERDFWVAETETLSFAANTVDGRTMQPETFSDRMVPSSRAAAAELFEFLSLCLSDRYDGIAEAILTGQRSRIRSDPLSYASLAITVDRVDEPINERAIVSTDPITVWSSEYSNERVTNRLFVWSPETEPELADLLAALGIDSRPPILQSIPQ